MGPAFKYVRRGAIFYYNMARCAASTAQFGAVAALALLVACEIPLRTVESAVPTEKPAPQPDDDVPVDTPPAGEQDRGPPALTVADVSAAERDGRLSFTVSPSHAGTEQVVVSFATADGTATAGRDYRSTSGTLTFPAAAGGARTIEVALVDDSVAEGNETFLLRLHGVRGATLAAAGATATIVDDDVPAVVVDPSEVFVPEGGLEEYTVVLGSRPLGSEVTVAATPSSPELIAAPSTLRFTVDDWQVAQTVTLSAAQDEDMLADKPVSVTHAGAGGGYDGIGATVTVTIVEDDAVALSLAQARASEGDGSVRFTVTTSLAGDRALTVDYATAADTASEGEDYVGASGTVTFPGGSTAAQQIVVAIRDDALDEPDEQLRMTLSNARHALLSGGGATLTVTGVIEDDDPQPQVTIADAPPTDERSLAMPFPVSLDAPSGRKVTVSYRTADGTAKAGADYSTVSGVLAFAAGSTEQTIQVPITDDRSNEGQERFHVTLSAPVNAGLERAAAAGILLDDDAPPTLSVADARVTEGDGDGVLRFEVQLSTASERTVTVDYATRDGSATAGADYTSETGTLTFAPAIVSREVGVTVADDEDHEGAETLTLQLSNPQAATLADGTATGTITDDDSPLPGGSGGALELASLALAGAGTMYPAFDRGIRHYAVRCSDATAVTVTAKSALSGARVTLLRADSDDNVTGVDTLAAQVTVGGGHDVAIELSAGGETERYVVHCIPTDFPTIRILTKTAGASDGLLFVSVGGDASGYDMIVDYHGVPRYHSAAPGWMFRPHANGPRIAGKQVRYSRLSTTAAYLMGADFKVIETVTYDALDRHDFVLGPTSYLFIRYVTATRDASEWDENLPSDMLVTDSVITEVPYGAGGTTTHWNSWEHLKISPDCRLSASVSEYAHLNSVQLVDGDVVASFLGCAQIVRLDRSSGSWSVEWQLGGSAPPRDSATEYLEIEGDPLDGFCAQHHATLTDNQRVLLFDNGTYCTGPRKSQPAVTRVVEYDISSGTQAVFAREYRRPAGHGYSEFLGGVVTLANGNWLIAWGGPSLDRTSPNDRTAVATEVDSAGTAVFHMNITTHDGTGIHSLYRVYHDDEANVVVPLNLP